MGNGQWSMVNGQWGVVDGRPGQKGLGRVVCGLGKKFFDHARNVYVIHKLTFLPESRKGSGFKFIGHYY